MLCERREASACLIILSAKQGSHWYHFYNVFGMTNRCNRNPHPAKRNRNNKEEIKYNKSQAESLDANSFPAGDPKQRKQKSEG